MSRDKVAKRSRDVWLEKETYTMLETFVIYKDILNGAYSSTVTKERKNSLWKEITSVIHNDHPECTEKTQEQVEKKWKNFIAAARLAIRNYNNGLTETGGGPLGEDGVLRPIYQKYYEEVLGLDNPAVSGTAIPGSMDTDDLIAVGKNTVVQQQIVSAITRRSDQATEEDISNEKSMEPSENNQIVVFHDTELPEHFILDPSCSLEGSQIPTTTLNRKQLEIESVPTNNTEKGKTLKKNSLVAERALFQTSIASISRPSTPVTSHSSPEPSDAFNVLKHKRDSSTLRQVMKKTKYSLCELGETTAQSRLTEQRLKVLPSAMDVREKLKDPVLRDELPEDLVDLLYNLKENV